MPRWCASSAGRPSRSSSSGALLPSAPTWWLSAPAPPTKLRSNGARLGWFLIPDERAVEVWPASGESQRLEQIELLNAGPEFPGLQLQLAEIWAG